MLMLVGGLSVRSDRRRAGDRVFSCTTFRRVPSLLDGCDGMLTEGTPFNKSGKLVSFNSSSKSKSTMGMVTGFL
jgi:hypothetical protein